MMKRTDCKRFRYSATTGYITDDLTGKQYQTLSSLCRLLNEVSDRGDRNAEEYYDLKVDYDAYIKVIRKYGIYSPEKLDLCLFNQKVW